MKKEASMFIIINFIILVVGFFALIKGADFFVDGSSNLAKAFRVPGLIIGLTIVALGTSAPELAVSTVAALQGSNEIAISNVVGSNIFNLLCVLGVCALIHPIPVRTDITKRDFPIAILGTLVVFIPLIYYVNINKIDILQMNSIIVSINRAIASILLLVFIIYILQLIRCAKSEENESFYETSHYSIKKSIVLVILGIVLIVTGGQAVVYSAKNIASFFGMTETLIGLTVVAVGTSLPELVTSIVAAQKGEVDMAVGNVVGSNIFNMMFILGLSSIIHPVSVNAASFWDMIILIVITIISYVFSTTGKTISRKEGMLMLLLYILDMIFAIIR